MMTVSYSLSLNISSYKDCWGYKSLSPVPHTRYGSIDLLLQFDPKGSNGELSPEAEQARDLLNGKEIRAFVDVTTSGRAKYDIIKVPGTLTLRVLGAELPIEIRLLDFRKGVGCYDYSCGVANCLIKLERELKEAKVSKGCPCRFGGTDSRFGPGAAKLLLNHPGEYYFSHMGGFVACSPENLQDVKDIYLQETSIPCPPVEKIELDPLSFTESPLPAVSKFAKTLVSGSLDAYR